MSSHVRNFWHLFLRPSHCRRMIDVMRIDVSSHGTPKAQFGKVACLPMSAEFSWQLSCSFRALLGQVSKDVNVNTWPRIPECAVALLPESIKGLLLHRCASGFDLPEDFVHFSRFGAFESKVNRARFRGEPHKIHKYRPLQTYLSHLAETKFGHIFQLKTMQEMRKKEAEMRSKAAWQMKKKHTTKKHIKPGNW